VSHEARRHAGGVPHRERWRPSRAVRRSRARGGMTRRWPAMVPELW